MANQDKLNILYMDIASRVSQMSYGLRGKVGAIITKNDNIISYGWNGTPAGMDNKCEELVHDEGCDETNTLNCSHDKVLRTKREVLHAEANSILKLVSSDGSASSKDSVIYTTCSPCFDCAKLIKQAKIRKVFYRDVYRDFTGVEFLIDTGVEVERLLDSEQISNNLTLK